MTWYSFPVLLSLMVNVPAPPPGVGRTSALVAARWRPACSSSDSAGASRWRLRFWRRPAAFSMAAADDIVAFFPRSSWEHRDAGISSACGWTQPMRRALHQF